MVLRIIQALRGTGPKNQKARVTLTRKLGEEVTIIPCSP